MEAVYPYAHTIHLILAIIFLGYVFTDVFMISKLKDKLQGDAKNTANKVLGPLGFKIFPLSLLIIVLTGGMMMSSYINSESGFFNTHLQQVLMFKIALALIIVIGVLSNIYKKFTGKTKSNFMENHFHKLVLVLGLFIVISAKYMFI